MKVQVKEDGYWQDIPGFKNRGKTAAEQIAKRYNQGPHPLEYRAVPDSKPEEKPSSKTGKVSEYCPICETNENVVKVTRSEKTVVKKCRSCGLKETWDTHKMRKTQTNRKQVTA